MTARRMGLRTWVASFVVGLTACHSDPWEVYPEPTAPDHACDVGSATHGYDVYIWDCLRGERVVVAQYSAEFGGKAAERDTSACGGKTALETRVGVTAEACTHARAGREWHGAN